MKSKSLLFAVEAEYLYNNNNNNNNNNNKGDIGNNWSNWNYFKII
jgi:hypothetical protein